MSLRVHPDEIVEQSSNGLLDKDPAWERVRVGEIAEIRNGFAFKSKRFNSEGRGVPLIRIRDVGKERSQTYYDGEFDDEYWVEPGDLIIGMDGEFRLARWRGPRSLLNQRVCRLRVTAPSQYDDRFLEHVLQGYLDAIHEYTSSVTVKHLSSKTIAQIPVPLPPLPEQQRIAEAIEEQVSRLAAGVESLQRARRNLRRMKRSVVTSAFHTDWPQVELGEVADISGGITKNKRLEADPDSVEIPYLRVANVQRGYLDLAEVKTIRAPRDKVEKTLLQDGDVLFTEGGDRDKLGRGWVWRSELERCAHQNHVFRARVDPAQLIPEFVSIYANQFGRSWFEEMGKQTTNLASISLSTLRRFPIPAPSLATQEAALSTVDKQGSILDTVEATINSNLDRAGGLRRSVLMAAFCGRLVGDSLGAV